MPRTFTLAEIRARVRQRVELEADGYFTDAELNEALSFAYTELYGVLVRSGMGYYPETVQSITTDGINSAYALPADHFSTLRVDWEPQANVLERVEEIQLGELEDYVAPPGGIALGYRTVGSNLELLPIPAAGKVYKHRYIPTAAKLTTDGQAVDGVNGWENLLIVETCVEGLMKQGDDPSMFMQERAELRARVALEAEERQGLSTRRIADVRRQRITDPADYYPRR